MTDTHTTNQGGSPRSERLERSTDGRIVAGVAEGLGQRLGISTGWVRLGFVVASFFGFGIFAYVVAWLAMPDQRDDESILERYVGNVKDWSSWVGIALIGLAGLIIVDRTGLISGELLFAGALIALGVLLYRTEPGGDSPQEPEPGGSGGTTATDSPPPVDPAPVADIGGEPPEFNDPGFDQQLREPASGDEEEGGQLPPPSSPGVGSTRPWRQPRARREPSYLGRFTIATALLVVGGIAAYDAGTTAEVAYGLYLAAFMIVIGGGLLVGAWAGRARWLVVPGLVLLPILITVSVLPVRLVGEIGERRITGIDVLEAGGREQMAIGDFFVDLRDIPLGTTADLKIELGIGQLVIVIPDDRAVAIDAELGMGELVVNRNATGGLSLERVTTIGEGDAQIRLEPDLGIGQLEIRRSGNSGQGVFDNVICGPDNADGPFADDFVCTEVSG